jgi:hypothetical protein
VDILPETRYAEIEVSTKQNSKRLIGTPYLDMKILVLKSEGAVNEQ